MKKKYYVIYCEKDLDHYGFLTNGGWNKNGFLEFEFKFSHSLQGSARFTDEYLMDAITDCLTDEGYNWHIFEW